MGRPPRAAPPRRYRVVGFLTGNMGLGVAARNTVRALEASGRSVSPVTLQNRWAPGPPGQPAQPPGQDEITLFHVNPSDIAVYRAAWRGEIRGDAPRVCVPFWELPIVPRDWLPLLRTLDAVLAPTRFIQEACARVSVPARVLHYPQAVFVPDVPPSRSAWGFPPGATVFLVSFDFGSDADRKNPWAAVEAFRRAFPVDPDVRLIIKTKPWRGVAALEAQARELAARVAADRRIQILERALPFDELMSLYASCDVMLALHRSEGLGLHLMEAMSLGRPVVATGWSGNMDFMSVENSVPVRHTLVPVRSSHDAYQREVGRPGQVWAEPDLAHAVEALRQLHASRDQREAMGRAAARDMERRRGDLLAGGPFAQLEAALPDQASSAAAFGRAIGATVARLTWSRVLRAPGFLARRVGLAVRGGRGP